MAKTSSLKIEKNKLPQDLIDGVLLRQLISAGTSSLHLHKSEVDALNVFPVPDGDTGTNMFLTFQAALKELNRCASIRVIDLLESAAYGALMGARGNSGVIVSQFFRGFVKALPKDLVSLSKQDLINGFNGAANLCYQAVRQPVEGTILTVIKEIAGASASNVNKSASIPDFITEIYQHACKVLIKTPEMLPILKQAGVVDAGGQGLVYFLKGFAQYLNGESIEDVDLDQNSSMKADIYAPVIDKELFPDAEINFQYCTEFILKGKQLDLEYIKNSLNPHGDCLLVVGDDDTAKIHIHTNNPGIILDFAVRIGDMSEIQIHNMKEQSKERLVKQSARQPVEDKVQRRIGILAVAAGDGIERIFHSVGVQSVVNGGQTMNPSIEDLVKAVSVLSNPEIIILPNNKNIILTANHVQDLVSKQVRVVPTENIPEGLAALMGFSEELPLDENINLMTEKSKNILSGEVTFAIRDFRQKELDIKQGDVIGLIDDELTASGNNPEEVIEKTLATVLQENHSLISIYYGSDITSTTAKNLMNRLETKFPQVEIELYYGGQPLYYYLFSIE